MESPHTAPNASIYCIYFLRHYLTFSGEKESDFVAVTVADIQVLFFADLSIQWVKWKSLSRVGLFATPWISHRVLGILQARVLEWVAFPFSRESSQPRDWTQVSHIAGRFFTSWATSEAQEYWSG